MASVGRPVEGIMLTLAAIVAGAFVLAVVMALGASWGRQ